MPVRWPLYVCKHMLSRRSCSLRQLSDEPEATNSLKGWTPSARQALELPLPMVCTAARRVCRAQEQVQVKQQQLQSASGAAGTRTAACAKVKEPDRAISSACRRQCLVGIKCKATHRTGVALEALHTVLHITGDYISRCLLVETARPQEEREARCTLQKPSKEGHSTARGSVTWSPADHTFTVASLPPLTAKMLPLLHRHTLVARSGCAATARSSVGCIMTPCAASSAQYNWMLCLHGYARLILYQVANGSPGLASLADGRARDPICAELQGFGKLLLPHGACGPSGNSRLTMGRLIGQKPDAERQNCTAGKVAAHSCSSRPCICCDAARSEGAGRLGGRQACLALVPCEATEQVHPCTPCA